MGNSDHRFRRVGYYSKVIHAPTKRRRDLTATPQHDEAGLPSTANLSVGLSQGVSERLRMQRSKLNTRVRFPFPRSPFDHGIGIVVPVQSPFAFRKSITALLKASGSSMLQA
jgi:hypothetical protein